MGTFKFIGTLKDFQKIIERLIEKYGKDTSIYEMIIKETGGNVNLIVN